MTATTELGADGLIHNKNLEIVAAHGCNLTCRSCTHVSPALKPKDVMDPAVVYRDLVNLGRSYRPRRVKILGGEPLLHPDIVGLIDAVRAAKITDRVLVVTNGVLLPRQPDRFWAAIDELWVSVYPGHEPTEEEVERWQALAGEHAVDVRLSHYDHFRESHTEIGTEDTSLVQRIYTACEVVNVWRCHTVIDGMFFKCPEAYYIPVIRGERPTDGVDVTDRNRLTERLLAYLNSPEPMAACKFCLGSVGKAFPHEQIRRRNWRIPQQRPTEELLDYEYLAARERDNYYNDADTWRVQETIS